MTKIDQNLVSLDIYSYVKIPPPSPIHFMEKVLKNIEIVRKPMGRSWYSKKACISYFSMRIVRISLSKNLWDMNRRQFYSHYDKLCANFNPWKIDESPRRKTSGIIKGPCPYFVSNQRWDSIFYNQHNSDENKKNYFRQTDQWFSYIPTLTQYFKDL